MKIDYIFDTNILIYILNKDPLYIDFIRNIKGNIGISVITYMEVLIGSEDTATTENFLDTFHLVNINKSIGKLSVEYLQKIQSKNLKTPKLADVIIASSSIYSKAKLVTQNTKDFRNFIDLEIVTPKSPC